MNPNDVDIQTDAARAYEVARPFADHMTRPVRFRSARRIRSHYGALEIDGVRVEVMGDVRKLSPDGTWEPPVDVRRHMLVIPVEGLRIPVLSLDYELAAYARLGRTETVRLLEQHLRSTRGSLT